MGRRSLEADGMASRRMRVRLSAEAWAVIDRLSARLETEEGETVGELVESWVRAMRLEEPPAIPQRIGQRQVLRHELVGAMLSVPLDP